MNPLIKELARKALKQPDTDNDGLTVFDNDELTKFAELIVRECISTVENRGGMCGALASNWIKEHFGVEE